MGQREQLVAWVEQHPGRCDDCAADALAFASRQRANQLGRALAASGVLSRVEAVCAGCGTTKAVSGVGTGVLQATAVRGSAERVLDGYHALEQVLVRAGYPSVVAAVAAHTVFLHPETVAQTRGQAVFPVVRAPLNTARRRVVVLADGRQVWADDNGPPTDAFLWAAERRKGRDVQFCHVWARSDSVDAYTALWNLCATPAFLAKTTDTDPVVGRALRHRAWELFGVRPEGEPDEGPPPGYGDLTWAPTTEPVADLEAVLRARMRRAPKRSATQAARELGWLFSGWAPDSAL